MTNFTSTHKFSAAAAFGAAALFSMLSFGGNAEAASVLSCKGSSAPKTVACCEQIVAEIGHRPLWMIEASMNCQKAVKCSGRRCFYKVLLVEDSNPERSRGRRGSGLK